MALFGPAIPSYSQRGAHSGKNIPDQTCARDWSLSASRGHNYRPPLNSSVLWCVRVCFRGVYNWAPMMSRDASLSDSCTSDRWSFPMMGRGRENSISFWLTAFVSGIDAVISGVKKTYRIVPPIVRGPSSGPQMHRSAVVPTGLRGTATAPHSAERRGPLWQRITKIPVRPCVRGDYHRE